jgi:hypothetical protein
MTMPPESPASTDDDSVSETRRRCIERYLLDHPEYDLPQTTGELIFWIGRQAGTGKLTVSATFHATPEVV